MTKEYEDLRDAHHFKRTPSLHYWRDPKKFDAKNVPIVTAAMWVVLEIIFALIQIPSARAMLQAEMAMPVAGVLAAVGGGIAIGFAFSDKSRAERPYFSAE